MYKFSEKSMHPSLRTCVDKIMSTDGADGRTDRQTDRVKLIFPHQTSFVGGGGIIFRCWVFSVQVFRKNLCTHLLEHAWAKSCPETGDRQTDRRTGWKQFFLRLRGGGHNYRITLWRPCRYSYLLYMIVGLYTFFQLHRIFNHVIIWTTNLMF